LAEESGLTRTNGPLHMDAEVRLVLDGHCAGA
jgi:hypothetical protein